MFLWIFVLTYFVSIAMFVQVKVILRPCFSEVCLGFLECCVCNMALDKQLNGLNGWIKTD